MLLVRCISVKHERALGHILQARVIDSLNEGQTQLLPRKFATSLTADRAEHVNVPLSPLCFFSEPCRCVPPSC